jgi:methionyl-tRNA formyltransferase
LHGSLLPKYRGAAPLNWAVINGETETGATTFFLKHEIDTGDLLFTTTIQIGEEATVGEVHDELMLKGADLMLKTVQAIEKGEYTPQPQDESQVSKAPKIFHETCQIDFNQNTQKVHDFIRGLSPYPTAWTVLDGKKLKVFRAKRLLESHDLPIGKFVTDSKKYLRVTTKDGFIELLQIQLQGRKQMDVKSFLNGYTIEDI